MSYSATSDTSSVLYLNVSQLAKRQRHRSGANQCTVGTYSSSLLPNLGFKSLKMCVTDYRTNFGVLASSTAAAPQSDEGLFGRRRAQS